RAEGSSRTWSCGTPLLRRGYPQDRRGYRHGVPPPTRVGGMTVGLRRNPYRPRVLAVFGRPLPKPALPLLSAAEPPLACAARTTSRSRLGRAPPPIDVAFAFGC